MDGTLSTGTDIDGCAILHSDHFTTMVQDEKTVEKYQAYWMLVSKDANDFVRDFGFKSEPCMYR